jgi:hypothetical protein
MSSRACSVRGLRGVGSSRRWTRRSSVGAAGRAFSVEILLDHFQGAQLLARPVHAIAFAREPCKAASCAVTTGFACSCGAFCRALEQWLDLVGDEWRRNRSLRHPARSESLVERLVCIAHAVRLACSLVENRPVTAGRIRSACVKEERGKAGEMPLDSLLPCV